MFLKKNAKRVTAMLLCICMVAGILPAGIQPVEASATDEIVYDFTMSSSYNKTNMNGKSGSNWSFLGEHANAALNHKVYHHWYTSAYGMEYSGGDTGEWIAYKFDGITAGDYNFSVKHLEYASGGRGKVYMMPYKEGWTINDCDESYYVGLLDCYNSSAELTVTESIGRFSADEDGSYVMVIKNTGEMPNGSAYRCIWIRNVTLASLATSFEASLAMPTVLVNDSVKLNLSLVVDGTDVDIGYDDVEVTFGTPGIASFDAATGEITALKEGNTEITVSTVYDTQPLSSVINLTVQAGLVFGDTLTYEFTVNGVANKTNMKGLSGSNWSFLGEHENASLNHSVYHHWYFNSYGIEISGAAKGEWVAYRFDDIAGGEYDVSAKHLVYASGGSAEVYMLPYSSDWSPDDCNESNYVGTFNCYLANGEVTVTDTVGRFKATKDGSYIMVLKNTGEDPGKTNRRTVWLKNITLIPRIPNFSASFGNSGIAVGSSTSLNIGLTIGANDVVDITYDDVTVSFGTDDIASFDGETGRVTGIKAGNTEVTISGEYEGEEFSKVLNLSVGELSGETYVYDFVEKNKYPLNQYPADMIDRNHDDGYLRYLSSDSEYIWIDIDVEKAGAYIAELENVKYAGAPIIKVHLVPENADVHSAVAANTYALGEIDLAAPVDEWNAKTTVGSVVINEPGKYRLVVQGTGRTSTGNYYCYLNGFVLDGSAFESAEISLGGKVYVGESYQTAIDAKTQAGVVIDGDIADIKYSSSSDSIAEIDENGSVAAKGVGQATLAAEITYAGTTKNVDTVINVEYPPKALMKTAAVKIAKQIVNAGETTSASATAIAQDDSDMDLSAAEITYSSSDTDVAEVDALTGAITAKAVGYASISADITLNGINKTVSQNIYVIENASDLSINAVTAIVDKNAVDIGGTGYAGFSAEIGIGDNSAVLTMEEIAELSGFEITYKSDNTNILSIEEYTGKYTAKAMGNANITVSVSYNGKTEKGTITMPVGMLAGKDYVYDFAVGNFSAMWETDYSYTNDTWAFHSNTPGWTPVHSQMNIFTYGIQSWLRPVGSWLALKIKVPKAGMYHAVLEYGKYRSGDLTDVYILRGDTEDVQASLVPANKIGSIDFFNGGSSTGTISVTSPLDNKTIFAEHDNEELILVFKATKINGDGSIYPSKLYLNSVNIVVGADVYFDSSTIEMCADPAKNSTQTRVLATLRDNTQITEQETKVSYRSSNPEVAAVDLNGKVTAKKAGTADITATIIHNGSMLKASETITVVDNSMPVSAKISAPAKVFVNGEGKVDFDVLMTSGATMKALENGGSAEFNVTIEPEGAAIFDSATGTIKGVTAGSITVDATLTYRGSVFEDIAPVTVVIEHSVKDKSTIYTDAVREAMQYNAANDTKIRSTANSVIIKADEHVKNTDKYYDMIVAEGLFRYYFVGTTSDPNKYNCRYCGTYIPSHGGDVYGWKTDPINNPWKVQCPGCRRLFPSNDFEKYYELGLDANGVFDRERANAAHIELWGGLDNVGYLKNDRYPEMDEYVDDAGVVKNHGVHGWGVDDGWGYTAKNAKTGTEEHHYYVAFYIHQAIWDGPDTMKKNAVPTVLEDLKNAYLYTGNAKYARTGIKILDRIADFYPDYKWYPWHDMRGDDYRGKIVDAVWSCGMSQKFIEAYDAFFPVYEDQDVINYLSQKAIEHETADENPKDSAHALRKHIEDNILRTVVEEAKDNNIAGNFGMAQTSVAEAAVVLNSMPETGEWLDWLFQWGETYNVGPNPAKVTGGNVMPQLMEVVDRDGMGSEGSPSYNNGWVTLLLKMANVLAGYEMYPTADLYKNPKFIKMFSAQFPLIISDYYTAQIGDSGSYASKGTTLNLSTLATAYYHTKEPIYAQAMYFRNGNSSKGLCYDETVKNPSVLADEVEEVIAKHGKMKLGSSLMSGYGFSILRDGDKYANSNTHRSIWMYFGKNRGHAHRDSLNINVDAFGLNLTPELGYPAATGADAELHQWVSATISHNTVTVDEKTQPNTNNYGFPIHFDDSGKVKVMDAERSVSYMNTDVYRRTVVMVEVDDTVSYGVDFFRVEGGDDHLYSFHAQSSDYGDTEGLNLIAADDPENTYAGVKNGIFQKYGKDPHPNSGIQHSGDGLTYPAGYTWMKNVESDYAPEKKFAVDFDITDFSNAVKDSKDIHLRMTMLNDFALDEVSVVDGFPVSSNSIKDPIKYVLARRKGRTLKTLFTTVLEPYKGERYLSGMEGVQVVRADGKEIPDTETVKAVKVIHKDERIDYVVYALDNTVDYEIIDGQTRIPFKGFVGVLTYTDADKNGIADDAAQPAYTYLHDGDTLIDGKLEQSAYTGDVIGYTEELTMQNYIEVKMDQQNVDLNELAGKIINVDNDGVLNGVYNIIGAEKLENGNIRLDIGEVTVIRGYVDNKDISKGYLFNIEPGQSFRIPLSFVEDSAPVLKVSGGDYKATAGKRIDFTVSATSESGKTLTSKALTLPRGASFDPQTNTFTWTPGETQLGEHSVAIKMSDGTLSTTYNARITVHRASGSVDSENTPQTPSTPTTPTTPSTPSTPTTPSGGETGTGSSGGSGSGGGGGGSSSGGGSGSDASDNTGDSNADAGSDTSDGSSASSEKFIDLGGYAWAKDAINTLAEQGIVNGTSATTFAPGKNITRADFALIMVRAFKLEADAGENFADVDANAYYAQALAIGKAKGIINGIGDNKYNPNATITRQDMMTMLSRALKALGYELEAADESVLTAFADAAQISDYASEHVAIMVANGLVNGKSANSVAPNAYTTRAEVAVLFDRLIKNFLSAQK